MGLYWSILVRTGPYWFLLVSPPQELADLPDYPKLRFRPRAPAPLELLVPGAEPPALDLLGGLLSYPARLRPRAHQALLHPFFFGPHELTPPPPPGGPRNTPDFSLDTPLELPPPGAPGAPPPTGAPPGTPPIRETPTDPPGGPWDPSP
ncbi:cyclin-dependent kinase 20-like, partial [Neopelma chrysocephalum]|uniref:cyclin-dependent kinase 20-like n=1 Tax=Neopelma chrysocephalum TaxID=114329 RepID=UPI000FCD3C68